MTMLEYKQLARDKTNLTYFVHDVDCASAKYTPAPQQWSHPLQEEGPPAFVFEGHETHCPPAFPTLASK